ncbi:mucin-1-like [Anastrepha ludens]|uniref:mucin-1-like n=1 Tax=Anastrepha ludens TaxID=28586 RepID=UPI0023B1DBD1|nr:mucin-1-like [Anastrepha ludens]
MDPIKEAFTNFLIFLIPIALTAAFFGVCYFIYYIYCRKTRVPEENGILMEQLPTAYKDSMSGVSTSSAKPRSTTSSSSAVPHCSKYSLPGVLPRTAPAGMPGVAHSTVLHSKARHITAPAPSYVPLVVSGSTPRTTPISTPPGARRSLPGHISSAVPTADPSNALLSPPDTMADSNPRSSSRSKSLTASHYAQCLSNPVPADAQSVSRPEPGAAQSSSRPVPAAAQSSSRPVQAAAQSSSHPAPAATSRPMSRSERRADRRSAPPAPLHTRSNMPTTDPHSSRRSVPRTTSDSGQGPSKSRSKRPSVLSQTSV